MSVGLSYISVIRFLEQEHTYNLLTVYTGYEVAGSVA